MDTDIHLLVLVHGMWGNPEHLAEMKRIILETKGAGGSGRKETDMELEVLVAHSNRDDSTYGNTVSHRFETALMSFKFRWHRLGWRADRRRGQQAFSLSEALASLTFGHRLSKRLKN